MTKTKIISPQHTLYAGGISFFSTTYMETQQLTNPEWILSIIVGIYVTEIGNEVKNLTPFFFFCSLFCLKFTEKTNKLYLTKNCLYKN